MMHVSFHVPHFSNDSSPIRVWEIISWTHYLCHYWPVDWLWVSDKYESEERGWLEAAWVQCPEASPTEVRARPRRAQVTLTDVHLVVTESIIMVTMWSLYATHYYCIQLTSCHCCHVFSVRGSDTDWILRAAPQLCRLCPGPVSSDAGGGGELTRAGHCRQLTLRRNTWGCVTRDNAWRGRHLSWPDSGDNLSPYHLSQDINAETRRNVLYLKRGNSLRWNPSDNVIWEK